MPKNYISILLEQYFLNNLIHWGQTLNVELISLAFLGVLYSLILILWRYFGKEGLFLYNILAIIIANIQVLKVTSFTFSDEPVALGTFLFATTFVVNDIITEHHGIKEAQLSIKLTIIAQLIITLLMIFTLVYPPYHNLITFPDLTEIQSEIQKSMYLLFAPSVRILIASLVAYYFAQSLDVLIYKKLQDYTQEKFLWLRLNLSNLVSGLADNIIFSSLAWVILNPTPISIHSLIFTYIFGTYLAKVIVSLSATPLIYLSYKFLPKKYAY